MKEEKKAQLLKINELKADIEELVAFESKKYETSAQITQDSVKIYITNKIDIPVHLYLSISTTKNVHCEYNKSPFPRDYSAKKLAKVSKKYFSIAEKIIDKRKKIAKKINEINEHRAKIAEFDKAQRKIAFDESLISKKEDLSNKYDNISTDLILNSLEQSDSLTLYTIGSYDNAKKSFQTLRVEVYKKDSMPGRLFARETLGYLVNGNVLKEFEISIEYFEIYKDNWFTNRA